MDRKPYQLLGETMKPLPMHPEDNPKTDSEYIRSGICGIIAEIELNVIAHQCLSRRIENIDWLRQELTA